MTLLLSVGGTVSITAPTSPGPAVVIPGTARITHASIDQPARPGTVTFIPVDPFVEVGVAPQFARFEVIVNGTTIDTAQILSLQVTRERRGRASAVLRVPRSLAQGWSDYTSPPTLGHIIQRLAPVPGKLEVTVNGIYISGGTKVTVPLITNAIADQTVESSDNTAGDISTISVVDAGGRYEYRRITLDIPPGHNTTRALVVAQAATEAEVASQALESSKRAQKAVELLDQEWMAWAESYLDTEGRDLRWDTRGTLICPVYGPEGTRARDWTITAKELRVDAAVNVAAPAAVPTRIIVTGERQIVDEECGLVTAITITNVFANYAPVYQNAAQDSLGDITTDAVSIDETFQIVGRTEVFRTKTCDRVLVERTRSWGWKNPISARYEIDDDEAISGYVDGVYGPTGMVKDDSAQVYALRQEVFCLLAETIVCYEYDGFGFLRERLTSVAEWVLETAALRERSAPDVAWDDTVNATVPVPTRVSGDLTPLMESPVSNSEWGEFYPNGGGSNQSFRGAVLFGIHPPPPPWPDGTMSANEPPPLRAVPWFRQEEDHLRLANGVTSVFSERAWSSVKVELVRHDYAIDEDGVETGGYKTSESTFDYGYRRRRGTLKLYRDGFTGRDDEPVLDLLQFEETRYIAESDTSHTKITSTCPTEESPKIETTFGQAGYLPAATRDTSVSPDPNLYPDAPASTARTSTQQMSHECIREDLEQHFIRRSIEVSYPWAEDEGELEDCCLRELREGCKIEVALPIMGANFLMDAGQRALVVYPRLDLNHDVYFDTVIWTWSGPGTPIVTDVKSDLYVI